MIRSRGNNKAVTLFSDNLRPVHGHQSSLTGRWAHHTVFRMSEDKAFPSPLSVTSICPVSEWC